MMNINMTNGGTTSQACAACKFQRRKCPADCPLAPYFPAEANQRFLSCKRLFGVSNMLRFLRDADPADRDETMKSLIYEAEVRDKDPVYGCLGIITRLSDQIKNLQRELELTRSLVHHQQQQQQQQQQRHSPPTTSLLQHSELVQSLSANCLGNNISHPLALPLPAYRHNNSHLALDDPFDFETHIEHKYMLRP